MRDIWDKEKIREKIKKEMARWERWKRQPRVIPPAIRKEYLDFLKIKEKSLAQIRKHHLDYLERKKYATEIFDFIEKDLGEAGFSKIH